MGVVIFNGVSSQDYGIQVEHPPGYQTPARDYEAVHIPGRNGDLIIDTGSYQNVNRSYELAIGDLRKDFTVMANMLSEWVNSASGYARLEDSYEPEYYRLAVFQNELEIENILQHAGRVTVDFNCKPQRFLKSGEEPVEFSSYAVLWNPTGFSALPRITVYGSGTGKLYVGNYEVEITDIEDFIVLDSDVQDAYKGNVNCNGKIKLKNGFPRLVPGDNLISWTGGRMSLEVMPRWWTL